MRLKKGFLFFSLLLIVSCMDEDIKKISNGIEAEMGLAIPLIHSTTTLGDLIPENENMSTDNDGLIRITYRQDSIAHILSDSLLQIENQEPTEEVFEIGEITLPEFSSIMLVEMSSLTTNLDNQTLAAQISEAIDFSQSHGAAYFPPIDPQSGGIYNADPIEEFQSVYVASGSIEIEITNNLAVEISNLTLALRNSGSSSVIGVFEFSNLESLASDSEIISLNGINMSSDLEMEIVNLSSPGTGNDPLDETSWVPISNSDELLISITGSSMIATHGEVKFQEQFGPDSTFAVDLGFEEDIVIDMIDLSEGKFVYSYDSDLNTSLELTIGIPQLLDENNNPFSHLIEVENVGVVSNSIALDNYSFNLSGSSGSLEVNYSTKILESNDFSSFNETDQINLSIGIEDLEFDQVTGYFGQVEQEIEEDVLELDMSALEDIATGIRLESPVLTFTTNNSIGIPFDIDIDLQGSNWNEVIDLNGPILEIEPDATTITNIDNSNSQLTDFIALNPSQITYSGTVISNPQGNTGAVNSLNADSDITIGVEMDLPLHLRIEDAVTQDTLAFDFGEDNDLEIDMIESVSMIMHTENEFPLDVSITMLFQDTLSSTVLDSLNFDLLEAASVNPTGQTIAARIYDNTIEFHANQIDALFESNQVVLDIRMNSFDSENTAIRLYTDYQFIIDAAVIVDLKIEQ